MSKLSVVPVSLRTAGDFIDRHHRHHKRLTIHKYAVGVAHNEKLVGVAIVARPANTALDDGHTLEVARTCTDGTKNVNSMLYAAAWRVAKEMGYSRMTTYTQNGESGSSLRAAGWKALAHRAPTHGWNTVKRWRNDHHQTFIPRTLWGIGTGLPVSPQEDVLSTSLREETRDRCTGCRRALRHPRTGRRKTWCSPACRERTRRRDARGAPEEIRCRGCDVVVRQMTARRRTWCSDRCRVATWRARTAG
jgi:hypothetical protein